MRLFEIIIIVLLLGLLIGELIDKFKHLKKTTTILLIFAIAIHIITEGIRWQMYPIYLISIIIILIRYIKIIFRRKWCRILCVIICFTFILTGSILSYCIPIFKLPSTTGVYHVGTELIHLESKNEALGVITIKTWFPTETVGKRKDSYSKNPTYALDGLMGMPGIVFSHLDLVKTAAYTKATPLKTINKFPLVLYAHGAASFNLDNTALLQEIASNGYVVVAVDFNFSFERYGLNLKQASTLTFQAQKRFISQLIKNVVPVQSDYIVSVVNELKAKSTKFHKITNFDKIALIGHSLGGTTCSYTLPKKINPAIIINMDGPMPMEAIANLNTPFLYISSYSPDLSDDQLSDKGLPNTKFYRTVKKWELENVALFFNRKSATKHWIRFNKASHVDLTDLPYIIPLMKTKGYDRDQGHQLKSLTILNFLNHYLRGEAPLKIIKNKTIEWII